MVHGLEEEAPLRVPGDDGRTFFAALEQGLAMVEPEVALLLLGVMALVAFRDEHRPDPRLEELEVRRLESGRAGPGRPEEQGEPEGDGAGVGHVEGVGGGGAEGKRGKRPRALDRRFPRRLPRPSRFNR
jgi:hypothetical protein